MSGLGNFGLSSLGSMSTLGSLAQSAQRLDRLMAGNRSRQQESDYGRNNSRRSMDDDFFGGRSSDRPRRRSPSPPRRFNRDDRRSDDRRDRGRRSRDDNIYGSTSGAGILGAAPSGSDRPSGNSGLGDLGGTSWNENSGNGGLNNLNSQTQQLINMMQTQQLLAAVQAQAKLSNQPPPSLMGSNSGYPRQGGRMMNQRGGRFNRNDGPRHGGFNRRDDRKRRRSPPPRPFKRERRDDNAARKDQNAKKTTTADKDATKKATKQEGKETKAKPQVKGAESKDKKQESTAESETKITKNAAGEDIEELVKANYDGKRYWCTLCKIVCMKSKNIYKHYASERHVKAAIEKEGKVFNPEIMKQQEPKKEKPKDISEFLKYVCSTKQTAKKVNNDIYISSVTDCTVKISDFTTEQDFMGSEFVKAVSGFKCQLCKIFMRHGRQIIEHLKGRKHNANYENYLKENPNYLESQRDVNKNLVEMLKKDEGNDVVLQESNGNARKTDGAELNTSLEEKEEDADFNMDEFDPNENSKVDDDDSKMADESTFDDSAINDSIEDYSLVESEKETEENKVDETEEKIEAKEIEEENEVEEKEVEKKEIEKKEVGKERKEVEKKEIEKKEVEEEDPVEIPEEKDKELPVEADEEEEEFPLLEPPANPIKEDESIEPEVEAKVPEVETKPKEPETPETPSEPAVEPEEVEEVTPNRRGRKAKRGRGSAKAATRGRRRTPRAAKSVKKTEEVVEPEEEVVDAPVETEKEQEKEAEPEVSVAEVASESVEDLPSSQEMEEVSSSQEPAGNGDVEGIDAFEIIDEVEGGSDEDSDVDE